MFVLRTFCCFKMIDVRLWLVVAIVHTLLLSTNGVHHRRSMASQAGSPVSKGGWRPVAGSGGLVYGSINTAPLHAHAPYKIPVPVIESYSHPSSARPLGTRDAAKVTSVAQSYRPTTLRTVPSPSPGINQPVNSYHNPFAVQNNGFSSYKFIQNFPVESVLARNPYNPYSQRPVYPKYQTKYTQNQLQNAMLQQLNNIHPLQFGYHTSKPLDMFGKPQEFARPAEVKKPQNNGLEVFRPEVYKLPDTDTASQSVSQQVRTAQQQAGGANINPYAQYSFQDSVFPPNILDTFGNFGAPPVKGRDPYQFQTKTTYLPPQPSQQTIFNSFNYSPNFKTTQTPYSSTTPRIQTTANQIYFGTTYNDFKVTPAPQTKVYVPAKVNQNGGVKDHFKPSVQDPFSKLHQSDYNKISVTTYNPVQTTTLASNFYDYNFQQNQHLQNFHNQNFNYDRRNKIHDSLAAGGNQQSSQQYANAPYRPTYEVTETTESDADTHSSTVPWTLTSQSYEYNNQKPTEESNNQEYSDSLNKPGTTTLPDLPEEYAIVTEAEKGHDNSLSYDSQVESQSRRPLGDDFEPIGKHKLKDYYYRVSTPTYNDFGTSIRTKKPTEKLTTPGTTTTEFIANKGKDEQLADALPTLPPNLHFKRPQSGQEPLNKDRIRKRNKIRRRRPPLANINRFREETTTHKVSTTEAPQTTEVDEVYTIRPRVRPTSNAQPNLTTPTVTTDLTTSALPTISPTKPTIVKKKLAHRRPLTTPADKTETTTHSYYGTEDLNKESQIMKIGTRPQFPKQVFKANLKSIEVPDFTHKQDEKDNPTSDVDISLNDTLKTTVESELDFSFHKDVKPIEAYKESTTQLSRDYDTTEGTTPRADTTAEIIQRQRHRNTYNRTRFNVKDYRNRLSSTTEETVENTPKVRFPHRRIPYSENENENTTERKRFTPKDPRHRFNGTEINEQTEKEIHSFKNNRLRQSTAENYDVTTARISPRIRNGQRRPRPTEETTVTSSPTTSYNKRILRKKIKDSETEESENVAVTETTIYDRNEFTSERARSESAIMKIADKKHHPDHLFEHSKRVSDLTLAASQDYSKPGMFKTVASNSRRIPNYFTIATDEPILPIEAFFPQLNQKKES